MIRNVGLLLAVLILGIAIVHADGSIDRKRIK